MKELDLSESIFKFPVTETPDLPRVVLKRLLFGFGLAPGSRVLDVGSTGDSLVPKFEDLGIETLTWCPSSSARGSDADDDSTFIVQPHVPDFSDDPFNLIIVRDQSVLQQSLLSAASIKTVVELGANLRPGATIAFLGSANQKREEHSDFCWERLLRLFPGQAQVEQLRTSAFRPSKRIVTHLRSLTLPTTAIATSEWRRIAAQAIVHDTNCCEQAAGFEERRAA